MKLKIMLLIIALSSAGCGRPGDGHETGSDKAEWSILQNLEYSNRGKAIRGIEYTVQDSYQIISLMGTDGRTRLWIMMDPKSPSFYKQIPGEANFTLTTNQLEEIRLRTNPITTVLQALESHRQQEKDNAEQTSAGDVANRAAPAK